jgi:hypothetical protein
VIAAFPQAVYVEVAGQVLVLVTPAVPPGPLHASVQRLPVVRVGDRVEIGRTTLRVARGEWSWASMSLWTPPTIDGSRLCASGATAADALTIANLSSLADAPLGELLAAGCDVTVSALAGLGPGLTPAGDDVLAGIFLVRALTGFDRRAMAAQARAAPTHAISRAFLTAAAHGECIEPAHRLLGALAETDSSGVDLWQGALARMGASSGCDLVLGMKLALQKGRNASQTACAGFLPGFDQKCGRSVRKWSASPAFNV